MNHLAHLFLSGNQPEIIVGNFITDMLSPKEQNAMHGLYVQGIKLHYFIDNTIDHHPIFKQSIALIKNKQGRYAPVVADIFYDFLLSHHWSDYSEIPYDQFKIIIYQKLLVFPLSIPKRIQTRLQSMVDRDFLASYKAGAPIALTFEFLIKRAKFANQFHTAHLDYIEWFEQLKGQFDIVFPEMIEKTKKFLNGD